MKRLSLMLAAIAILASSAPARAQSSAIGADATCTTAGLTAAPVVKVVNNLQVWVRRLATIKDAAMDDFGVTAPGDELWIFCVTPTPADRLGRAAFCLSKEQCPWWP